jgi:hypothetical protein
MCIRAAWLQKPILQFDIVSVKRGNASKVHKMVAASDMAAGFTGLGWLCASVVVGGKVSSLGALGDICIMLYTTDRVVWLGSSGVPRWIRVYG